MPSSSRPPDVRELLGGRPLDRQLAGIVVLGLVAFAFWLIGLRRRRATWSILRDNVRFRRIDPTTTQPGDGSEPVGPTQGELPTGFMRVPEQDRLTGFQIQIGGARPAGREPSWGSVLRSALLTGLGYVLLLLLGLFGLGLLLSP